MDRLDFTLLTDGSSDAILLHPLHWILQQHLKIPVDGTWAELRELSNPPKGLTPRIEAALDLYPCDILFVHRDAERDPYQHRVNEINNEIDGLPDVMVPVVPVRMQESWLLFNESAIREAAGNPNGKTRLTLPSLNRLEALPDPKDRLHELLREASEHRGRRLKRFSPGKAARRLGEILADYGPLRSLPAFQHTENRIVEVLKTRFDVSLHT